MKNVRKHAPEGAQYYNFDLGYYYKIEGDEVYLYSSTSKKWIISWADIHWIEDKCHKIRGDKKEIAAAMIYAALIFVVFSFVIYFGVK